VELVVVELVVEVLLRQVETVLQILAAVVVVTAVAVVQV
jgi:hypothetical protein